MPAVSVGMQQVSATEEIPPGKKGKQLRGWVVEEEGPRGINGNGKKYNKNKLLEKSLNTNF